MRLENSAGTDDGRSKSIRRFSINQETRRYLFAFSSLFFLIYLVYGNSFQGVWVFDDHGDILKNKIISSFNWTDFIRQYLSNRFFRPLVNLSFVLNYHFGGYDIYGYHILNFAIHLNTAFFIFLFVYKAITLPSVAPQYGAWAYSIALLTAAFWCTSPLHVTAVTYIVQRYTSMAGMFYLMALFFFISGRTAGESSSRFLNYIFCAISAILAFLSKENTATLPIGMYLCDLLLIRGASREHVIKDLKRAIWPIAGLLIVGIIFVSTTSFPLEYRAYTFTLKERLLTEPRIVLFYLSLLIYPMPTRLMLDHGYILSSSLFCPWTTWVSICVILFLVGLAFFLAKKDSLIAFCILFFFLNHVIESSIIPIEIVYEYRNYVPSVSFFILISLFLVGVLHFFRDKKAIFFMVAGCMAFLLITQGDTVYRRNTLFHSERLLYLDNTRKAPNFSRPRGNLALSKPCNAR